MSNEIINKMRVKMEKVIEGFEIELTKIRTGRANPNMLNHIMVDYYGTLTPINQTANISVPEARQLVVKPFDRSIIQHIVSAINKSDLGLTAQNQGDYVRIEIPQLTQERRKELVKTMYKEVENFKVAIRNDRRDANDVIKKDDTLNEDLQKYLQNTVQKVTDEFIKIIDNLASKKEKELMEI